MSDLIASPAALDHIRRLAREAGIGRVHMFAWRDLDDAEAGGSEVHADNIATIWAQAGLEVHMRTSQAAGLPERATRSGYEVTRKSGRYTVFPRTVAAELAGRNGSRDALVEIWNGVPFLSPLWARGPKMIWLHHLHGPMWGMSLPKPIAVVGETFEEKIAPKFYRNVPIVTLSNSSRDELVDDMGFSASKVDVVPPGIDRRFTSTKERSATPLLVAVGRLVPVKDFPRLISIMSEVHRSVPTAKLVIVGEGYERDALERQISELDAADYIELRGRISDEALIDLYSEAWALMSVSIREGWGMTITEAAACGTPAVATKIAGHNDAVTDGVSGLLHTSDQQLTEATVDILTKSDLRSRLSDGARARAGELTWERAAIDTFSVLAKQGRGSAKTNIDGDHRP